MTLERGTLLHKRYRIVEILGQGGMGSVYRAVDENLGVDIALKENLFTTDEYARQFRLEAVILANLRHPNLPRVSDHFVLGEQGQYLVMDFIDGEDLRQRMERAGTITEEEAIMIGASMCDALAYLHTRKPPILHRDIKPGNVKITPDGHIFLVDFGLAKVVQGSQATTTGARAMTPGYSPPEQYGTARTDPRTDIYSLGATLYAALTGIIPEDGLARAMDNAQLTPLRKRNSKISRRLASAIEQAMAIDPADRFQSAEDFKGALLGAKSKTQRLTGNYTVPPPPVEEGGALNDVDGKEPKKPIEKKPELMAIEPKNEFKPPKKKKRKKRNSGWLWSMLLILLLLAGAAGVVSYISPELVPGPLAANIPWIVPTPTPTSMPTPTFTPAPTETVPLEATATSTVEPPTTVPTNTVAPPPTDSPSPTPLVSQAASPTPVGGGYGQVAFASERAGLPQVYLVGADGSNLQPLTSMPEGACQPAWSPDGTKLIFTSPCKLDADTYREASLYSMNADGSELTPLTTAPGGDFDPAWASDGKRIAFTSLRDGNKEIYVLNLESQQLSRLTNTGRDEDDSQPFWSPDGTQIVFVKTRFGALQIWLMSATGENPTQLVRSGQEYWDFAPTWSPNGEYIIFSQQQANTRSLPWLMQIRFEDRDTQTASRFVSDMAGIQNIHYSPDGFWIAYEGGEGLDKKDIYYMTASGGTRTQLTSDSANDFDPAWRPITSP